MKKLNVLALAMLFSVAVFSQKYAFVDTQYILENMEEYATAQTELDQTAADWQTEIEERYEQIERLYKAYQAEAVLLTDEMKSKREEEIVRKEQEAKQLQKKRFGVEGDLYQKRQTLIQPIQEQIYGAIREYATEGGYMAIFDMSGQSNVLYANTKYDKSDKILRKLGIRPGEFQSTQDEDESDNENPQQDKPEGIERKSDGGGDARPTEKRP